MTTTTIKGPVLVNYDAESRRLGVARMTPECLSALIRLGDSCKLRTACGEFIWASVSVINQNIFTGVVTTPTIFAPQHGIYCQDIVKFAAENIIEVSCGLSDS